MDELNKVLKDFLNDVTTSFPEIKDTLNVNLNKILCDESDHESSQVLLEYFQSVFPERFFDILYQKSEIFQDDTMNTEFLPGIEFKNLWNDNISDKTKDVIWKYLQLILFNVVGTLKNNNSFGDTAKLFEAINQDELHDKLKDTMNEMGDFFTDQINLEDMPNADNIHSHLNSMLDGNLGKLAREIAEETASDLNLDLEGASSVNDVFEKLFKNPTKLMDLVGNVGNKLDTKLKSGDIKESDMIKEASEILDKMKNMPGMDNIQTLLSKMGGMPGGMPGGFPGANMGVPKGGGKPKVNINNMQSQLDKNLRQSKQRERMLKKLEERRNNKKN